MIKLHYGSDAEKAALSKSYLSIFKDIGTMRSDWLTLRDDLAAIDPMMDAELPKSLDDLLTADFKKLVDIYDTYTSFRLRITEDMTKRAKVLFSYDRFEYNGKVGQKRSSAIARFFCKHADDMKVYTCHYCDMAYVNVYNTGPRKKSKHFDLDHVLDKGQCPIIALSFFNLVPVCPVCNSRIKSTKQITGTKNVRIKLSPTSDDYDFENKVKIWVDHPAGKCSTMGFEKRMNEYELKFDTHLDPDYDEEIKFFRLHERYNYHKCEALRLMDLKERYTEARIVEMARLIMGDDSTKPKDLKGDSVIASIQRDIFADDFMEKHPRVFGKLHKDIMS